MHSTCVQSLHQAANVENGVFLGIPPECAPHSGGKRRVEDPIKSSKSLVENTFTTSDYTPFVKVPSKAR